MSSRSLAALIEAAEKKKQQAIREKLGLAPCLRLTPVELECLSFHLSERSGPARVQLTEGNLHVSDLDAKSSIAYRGVAADLILERWKVSHEQAQQGLVIELESGKRIR